MCVVIARSASDEAIRGASTVRFLDCFAEPVISARALLRSSGARIRATRWLAMTNISCRENAELYPLNEAFSRADRVAIVYPTSKETRCRERKKMPAFPARSR